MHAGMLFGWELVLSFILVTVVYAVAIGEPSFGNIAPFAVGLSLVVDLFAGALPWSSEETLHPEPNSALASASSPVDPSLQMTAQTATVPGNMAKLALCFLSRAFHILIIVHSAQVPHSPAAASALPACWAQLWSSTGECHVPARPAAWLANCR